MYCARKPTVAILNTKNTEESPRQKIRFVTAIPADGTLYKWRRTSCQSTNQLRSHLLRILRRKIRFPLNRPVESRQTRRLRMNFRLNRHQKDIQQEIQLI